MIQLCRNLSTHLTNLFLIFILQLLSIQISLADGDVNLLTNPGAEENYMGWSRSDDGSGWSTTFISAYSGFQCWSSSYRTCTLTQTIDLLEKGYTRTALDLSPEIFAGVFVATHWDSDGYVTIRIQLLDSTDKVIYTKNIAENNLMKHKYWLLQHASISGYPAGMRKIRFTMAGMSSKSWAGQYGPSFDDAFVFIPTKAKAFSNNITQLSQRNAILHAVVYPNNKSNQVLFEYGTTSSLGSSVNAEQSPVTGTTAVNVNKSLTLKPNTTYYWRAVTKNVTDTSYTEVRSFKTPDVILTPSVTTISIGDTAGSKVSLNVTSSISWEALSDAPWLNVSPTSKTGNATITLEATEANPTVEPRYATLKLSGDTLQDILITVTQPKGSINLIPTSLNVDSDADTFSIKVRTIFNWSAVSEVPWIKISSDSVSGSSVIKFTITENAGRNDRTGNITFSNRYLSNKFTIVQKKGVISISPKTANLKTEADTLQFTIQTNFTWAAQSNVPWLKFSMDSVHGNSVLTVIVEENLTELERTGTVTVSNSRISNTLSISQRALKGLGTAESPYLIRTYNGLKSVNTDLYGHYKLLNDIDAGASLTENSGKGFEPIGSWEGFYGVFDGNGFVIKNLMINRNSQVGLFSYVNYATVRNLGLINCSIRGTSSYTGAICGYAYSATIENCFVSGSIRGTYFTGGLVGYSSGSQIKKCYSTGYVSADYSENGGLVGSIYKGSLSNSYSTALVSNNYRGCGGIAGYVTDSYLENCYGANTMNVNSEAGGITPYYVGSTSVNNYYNSDLYVFTVEGFGTPQNTSRMKSDNNFDSWDFDNIWIMYNDSTYPGLRSVNNAPFAFRDTIEIRGYTSIRRVLDNDFDIESLQENLVLKINKVNGPGGLINKRFYQFPEGTAAGTFGSLNYRIGEILSPGDTLWGNEALAVFNKIHNNPPMAVNDTFSIMLGDSIIITNILDNDIDEEKNHLILDQLVSTKGSIKYENNTLTYTSVKDWYGLDSVLYRINDGEFYDTAWIFIKVNKIPEISWSNPSDIVYGTELDQDQLNAVADVPGTFRYDPEPGTVINCGTAQPLTVWFTPEDTVYCLKAQKTVYINVKKAVPQINWNNEEIRLRYGSPLEVESFVLSTETPGSFEFDPVLGTILNVGDDYYADVIFRPYDTLNYYTNSGIVYFSVDKAVPHIDWNEEVRLVYGEPLEHQSFVLSTETPGSFEFDPPLGTIPDAGENQLANVIFRPDDNMNYHTYSGVVNFNVSKAQPQINWYNEKVRLVYGESLELESFVLSTDIPGSFEFDPALGTIPDAGENQQANVIFRPNDTVNYHTYSGVVNFSVGKATLYITAEDLSIVQGAPVPELTVNYTGFVNGDSVDDLDELPEASTSATSSSGAGQYPIILSGGSDNNYVYELINGVLEIIVNTGLNSSQTQVKIFPNPVTDLLQISGFNNPEILYSILTLSGIMIEQGIVTIDSCEINVSHLKPGNYLLKLVSDGNSETHMIIKQ